MPTIILKEGIFYFPTGSAFEGNIKKIEDGYLINKRWLISWMKKEKTSWDMLTSWRGENHKKELLTELAFLTRIDH